MTGSAPRAAILAGLLALAGGCGGGKAADDLQALEKAYEELRDAVLRDDDEAFFRMHCRAAREAAMNEFPAVRSRVLALPAEERLAFERGFGLGSEEFAKGDARALVVKIMPWKSGWKPRREIYRRSPVKDVRFETVPLPGGGEERRGVVVLDIKAAVESPGGQPIPENFLPTIVFVKDPEGWRRRWFFVEN